MKAIQKTIKEVNKMEYIYKITNKITGRLYIGRTTDPETRMRIHLTNLKNHNHSSSIMQEDYDKYGKDSFCMTIIQTGEKLKDTMFEYIWMVALKTYDEEFGYNSQDPYFTNKDGTPCLMIRELKETGIYNWKPPYKEKDKKNYKREADVWRGNWLRERLDENNITIKECGKVIEKTESTMSKKIRGVVPLYLDEIEEIGNFLGLKNEEKSEWAFGNQ